MITAFGITVTVADAVQIFILYLIIYALLKYSRGSRFGQTLMGAVMLAAILVGLTKLAHLEVLSRLFGFILLYLAVSSVVIFQPEIRRLLPAIGTLQLFKRSRFADATHVTPERLTDCIISLSKRKIGALVAIERGISLRGYMDSGIPLDAVITPEILISIFTPPLPLHDGGLVIHSGRIAAAHCVFPVSNKPELISSGMRHRAAVGLSEETDALVVVVSEETGRIAIAHGGRLERYPAKTVRRVLQKWITKALNQRRNVEDSFLDWAKALARHLSVRTARPKDGDAAEEDARPASGEESGKESGKEAGNGA